MAGWLKGTRSAPSGTGLPEPASGSLVYAVGDIHGRLDLLEQLLDLLETDIRETISSASAILAPTVIFLGDYIDRGPQSAEVIERLISLEQKGGAEWVFLRGNHDQAILDFIANPASGPTWASYGGLDTLASYGVPLPSMRTRVEHWAKTATILVEKMPLHHLRFLKDLIPLHVSGSYAFVHAGVRPELPLDNQSVDDLLWIREPFLSSRRKLSHVIVHGHTPTTEPYNDSRRIGIDTGAYTSGRLTAVRLLGNTQTFMQTQSVT